MREDDALLFLLKLPEAVLLLRLQRQVVCVAISVVLVLNSFNVYENSSCRQRLLFQKLWYVRSPAVDKSTWAPSKWLCKYESRERVVEKLRELLLFVGLLNYKRLCFSAMCVPLISSLSMWYIFIIGRSKISWQLDS